MEGQTTRYRRAQAWTPTAADLQAIDGRYESTELGNVLEIVPGANGIAMRFERAHEKSVDLAPVERDTYMQRMMFVRVRRDAGGKVVGFEYGNPVVRSLSFTRLGARSGAASTPPIAVTKEQAPAAPNAAAPRLETLVGEYEFSPGRSLAITLDGGRLYGQPSSGGGKLPLTRVAGAKFAAEGRPITLTFAFDADGAVTSLVMNQNGNDRTLLKVK